MSKPLFWDQQGLVSLLSSHGYVYQCDRLDETSGALVLSLRHVETGCEVDFYFRLNPGSFDEGCSAAWWELRIGTMQWWRQRILWRERVEGPISQEWVLFMLDSLEKSALVPRIAARTCLTETLQIRAAVGDSEAEAAVHPITYEIDAILRRYGMRMTGHEDGIEIRRLLSKTT